LDLYYGGINKMGNLSKYVFFMTTLVVLFYLAGITGESSSIDDLLELVTNPGNLFELEFWSETLVALNAAALAGAIAIGVLSRNVGYTIKAAFIIFLANLLTEFMAIFSAIEGLVNIYVAMIFFGPLLVVWVLSLLEWVFGGD